jgi:predicted ester cyclase
MAGKEKEMVERVYNIFSSGKIEQLNQLFHEDVVLHNLTEAGEESKRGIKYLVNFFIKYNLAFSHIAVTIHGISHEDGKYKVRFTFDGLHTGPSQNMKPSGREVFIKATDAFTFKEGKISEVWREVEIIKIF